MQGEQHSSLAVAPEPTSVGDARRFLRSALYDWDADTFEETATLLVSELVTNVVLHARTAAEVVVLLASDRLRVEVHDGSSALPAAKHYGVTATTGRGVGLLESMSSAWGAVPTATGKSVWFELEAGAVAEVGAASAASAPFLAEPDPDALEAALIGELGTGAAAGEGDGDADGHGPALRLGWRVLHEARR